MQAVSHATLDEWRDVWRHGGSYPRRRECSDLHDFRHRLDRLDGWKDKRGEGLMLREGFGFLEGAAFLMAATGTTLIIYNASNRLLSDAVSGVRSKI